MATSPSPGPEPSPSRDVEGSFALRLGAFYAALFLINGLHLPYFPVWLSACGLSPADISLVVGAPFFVRLMVTPVAALVADTGGRHRSMVLALAWAAFVLALLLSKASGFWPIMLLALLFALCLTTIMPLTETICVGGVRTAGLDYGRMRLWGSLAFIGVGFAGGVLIESLGAYIVIWLIAAAAGLTALAARLLPGPAKASGRGAPSVDGERAHALKSGAKLLASPPFLLFLLATGAVQGAHAMLYTLGVLHWQAQGLSSSLVGALWALGVLAEVALFAWSGAIVRRLGALTLVLAGAAASVLRWSVMSVDPPLSLLVPLQILHALTYGATHLGAMHFIARNVPDGAAGTAQALYATVAAGMAMGGATLLSGALYGSQGGATYLAMALLSAVGLGAALLLWRNALGAAPGEPSAVNPTTPETAGQ